MDSFDPTFFDKQEGETKEASKARIRAYIDSIQSLPPYAIHRNIREGWSRYKGLKYVRKRGWWKDSGIHQLCRNMVALGLKDAPLVIHEVHHNFPGTGGSLYWMAAHDITETDSGGIKYYRHVEGHWSEQEDDE